MNKKEQQQKKLRNKNTMDRVLQMYLIHCLQVEAFAEAILSDKKVVQMLKRRISDVFNSVKLSNSFFESIINEELEETSSQVSDSILLMIDLPDDKLDELAAYIDEYCKKNTGDSNEKTQMG